VSETVCDITIIGAGPVGLAAAYYAGHRDASVRIVESLGQLGGQVAAVYPEKHVYDVAGHPRIQGQALVEEEPPDPSGDRGRTAGVLGADDVVRHQRTRRARRR